MIKVVTENIEKLRSHSPQLDAIPVAGVFLLASLGIIVANYTLPVPSDFLIVFEIAILWTIYSLLVLGLNIEFGFAGLINFGHLVFYLVGGYTFALISGQPSTGVGLGYHWLIGIVLAVTVAGAFGALIGAITLRLRGDFLAIVTLAALEVMLDLVNSFSDITGGSSGLYNLPSLDSLVTDVATNMVMTFLLFTGIVLLTYKLVEHLTSAPYGRVLRAIRSDEIVARTLGKNTVKYKLQTFIIGSMIAGLAGVLIISSNGSVSPDYFSLDETIIVWIGMFIGGVANNRGVMGGVAIILMIQLGTRYLNETISSLPYFSFGPFRMMLIGFILVLIVRYQPGGLWGKTEEMGV
jgi:branched-chain amino acid transport system permease protein